MAGLQVQHPPAGEFRRKIALVTMTLLITLMPAHLRSATTTISFADFFLPVATLLVADQVLKNFKGGVGLLVLAYLAAVVISAIPASTRHYFDEDAFALQFVKNGVSVVYFLAFMALLVMARNLRWVATWLTIVGCIVATIAFSRVFILNLEPRAYYPFFNANALAAFLALPFFLQIGRLLHDRHRALPAAACLVLALGLVATGSRGALTGVLLGLLATIAFIFLSRRARKTHRTRATAFIAVLLAVGVSVLILNVLPQDIAATSRLMDMQHAEDAGGYRLALWRFALRLFEQSPLVGVGLGQFRELNILTVGNASVSHNTYLAFMAELGVLGLLVWMSAFVVAGRNALKGAQLDEFSLAIPGYLICAAFQASLNNTENLRILWLGFAFAAVATTRFTWQRRPFRREFDQSPKSSPQTPQGSRRS